MIVLWQAASRGCLHLPSASTSLSGRQAKAPGMLPFLFTICSLKCLFAYTSVSPLASSSRYCCRFLLYRIHSQVFIQHHGPTNALQSVCCPHASPVKSAWSAMPSCIPNAPAWVPQLGFRSLRSCKHPAYNMVSKDCVSLLCNRQCISARVGIKQTD